MKLGQLPTEAGAILEIFKSTHGCLSLSISLKSRLLETPLDDRPNDGDVLESVGLYIHFGLSKNMIRIDGGDYRYDRRANSAAETLCSRQPPYSRGKP